MFPLINMKETGINLRRLMDKRGITVKEVKQYLNLTSVQSVYNWCNGLNLPTVDNLYALSQLLDVPMDAIVCGNRMPILRMDNPILRRLYAYCKMLNKMHIA